MKQKKDFWIKRFKMELKELEKEIDNIKTRNKRVELDKKWETCWTRKICICILTYIVVIAYSYIVRNYSNILLSSLVPVIGLEYSVVSSSPITTPASEVCVSLCIFSVFTIQVILYGVLGSTSISL